MVLKNSIYRHKTQGGIKLFRNKFFMAFMAVLIFFGGLIFSSTCVKAAEDGWEYANENWYYYENGNKVEAGWVLDSNGWCYLSPVDGSWVQEGWVKDSHGWGYIQNGYWVKNAMWVLDSKGWSHIDNDGYWDGETAKAVPAKTTNDKPNAEVTGDLKISYINVGLAEAILIQQGSHSMLVDAGYEKNGPAIKRYISQQGITRLDYVIGTHPHEDHIGGLPYIIDNISVGKIYMPKVTITTEIFDKLMTDITAKGKTITIPVPGSSFKLGDAFCTFYGPINTDSDDMNTYSTVFKLTFGKNSFLFTSDAGKSNEQAMINAGYDLSADVLKVGHHGVFTSTSQAFLEAVNPKYAVISVGDGSLMGPPAPEVLTRLYNNKIITFRTDMNGTIVCTSDGNNITFSNTPVNLGDEVSPSNIQITALDINKELVKIKNTSKEDQDMSGWRLVSTNGGEAYYFPENFILKAGDTMTIASGNAEGDLKWSDNYIWNNNNDSARLYDKNGELISTK